MKEDIARNKVANEDLHAKLVDIKEGILVIQASNDQLCVLK